MFKINKKVSICIICFLFLVTGFLLGFYLKPRATMPSSSIRENTNKYNFIHPLLAVNRDNPAGYSPQYENLAKKVTEFIAKQKSAKIIDSASVYFIDYTKQGSFNINSEEKYDPASLLKVVIMVAYLKQMDDNPGLAKEQFTYTRDIADSLDSVPFQTPSILKSGQSYSVSDLIDQMITNSDNGAKDLLLAHMDDNYLNQVYKDLGLEYPSGDSIYKISTQAYSLFFRVLYNATYLSKTNSERALYILSKANYQDGLRKLLPANIIIAHKFGEHVNGEGDRIDSIELHDCGIIYTSSSQYLLCVMTSGKNITDLSNVLGNISKIVYDAAR
jgi:beta-lactamase class A